MRLILAFLLFPLFVFAQLNNIQRQELVYTNILGPYNPGFENVKAGWTASGGTFAMGSTTNVLIGAGSATWNSNGAAQTFSSTAVTVPYGLMGVNGLFQCLVMTPSGTATHTIQVFDGSNILVSQTITSSTVPTMQSVNFIFPSSGTVRGRIVSVAADEPLIAIDECYLGKASNLLPVNQAVFVGEAKIPGTSSCAWSNTGSTLDAFGTDSDCPGPTVVSNPGPGTIQTTDADLPRFTVNSLPPGTYTVQIKFHAIGSVASSNIGLAIFDGTTTSPGQGVTAQANNRGGEIVLQTQFTYTSTANRTFEVYGAADANNVLIDNSIANIWDMTFNIYRWPSASEITARVDQLPSYWSGYHDTDCYWNTTSTTYVDPSVDGSCTFTEQQNVNFGTVTSAGAKTPGIVFTPKRAGRYFVCANPQFGNGAASYYGAARLTDGTTVIAEGIGRYPIYANYTLCGIYNAASVASTTLKLQIKSESGGTTEINASATLSTRAIGWQIFALDQQYPMPQYVGSVTNSGTGGVRVEAAEINCDSGASIMRQINGSSWISSVGNVSGGQCAITIATGIFSATPVCTVTYKDTMGTGFIVSLTGNSATSLTSDCERDDSVECTSYDFNLICVGAR